MNERIEELMEILAPTRGEWHLADRFGVLRHKIDNTCPLQYIYDSKIGRERHLVLTDDDIETIVMAVDNRPQHNLEVRQRFIETLIGT